MKFIVIHNLVYRLYLILCCCYPLLRFKMFHVNISIFQIEYIILICDLILCIKLILDLGVFGAGLYRIT